MRKARHYRGGYQVAGLTNRPRELRESQTPAEDLMWSLLRDKKLLGFKFRRNINSETSLRTFIAGKPSW